MTGAEIKNHLQSFGINPVSVMHNGKTVVLLVFGYDPQLIGILKRHGGRWSRVHKCWYIERSKFILLQIIKEVGKVKGIDIVRTEIKELVQMLELKSYSSNTIRCYGNAFSVFLDHIYPNNARECSREEIEKFLLLLARRKKYSEAAIHTMINAIKFYMAFVLKKPKEFYDLPRPQKPLQLPKVLGQRELERLFRAVSSKKQKAILFTAYSAGLRVSEVVNIELKHIDSERMQIFVERAKGKKDRYVNLSPVLLDILRSYIRQCNPRPVRYLFEGSKPGEPYAVRTAQKVFQLAKEKAGIKKDVSFHSLRHSFATHLLENGIDIRYIKEILGHFNITTTERYLHVRREQLVEIKSPLDRLWETGGIEW